ncbi:MAG: hypothetical protein ACJAWV_001603 [Flammeovirgaceae bacterium]|jgi:hypothetical protein
MNNKYILILSGFMLFGSSCEEPKQQESVEINFNTESEQYRNVKTKNLSPYSLFGDSSIVLMTEEEYKNEHITEVLNSNEDAEIAKLVFENNTGFVNIYNKQGKLIDRLLMDDKVLAKFISVDPLAEKAPDWTPYRYGFNNPINYIDPDGRWEVRINEKSNNLEFTAEKGDNLNSLSKQLGISKKSVKNLYGDTKISQGESYGFGNIEQVGNINKQLNSANIEEQNCCNFALGVNGIDQPAEFGNKPEGYWSLSDATERIDSDFTNISKEESRAGDLITFIFSEENAVNNGEKRDFHKKMDEFTERPSHYAIVVLKSKDGKSVQSVIEKPGTLNTKISSYPKYDKSIFEPYPKKGYTTPFFRKK